MVPPTAVTQGLLAGKAGKYPFPDQLSPDQLNPHCEFDESSSHVSVMAFPVYIICVEKKKR
jgi:hypothetical protein